MNNRNSRIIRSLFFFSLVAVVIIVFSSCGDTGIHTSDQDSDRDGLSDVLEERLGTDHLSPDSDGDGLTDGFEAFGLLAILPSQDIEAHLLVDVDQDGIPAISDSDDNGDGVHDGQEDHDTDGIPNALEYYGFTYDATNGFQPVNIAGRAPWVSGQIASAQSQDEPFDPFNPDTWEKYFKTDPTVASTDRDPYTDFEEITGVKPDGTPMDSSVQLPGSHPLIPAYPDIFVTLSGFKVTPNADISSSEQHLSGTSWSEQTVTKDKTVTEWDYNSSINAGIGSKGWNASVDASVEKDTTHTVDNTTTTDNSSFSRDQWSKAISTNTLKAASLSLQCKVVNMGTAVAKKIIPTVNLMIGGKAIRTIPFNGEIDMLTARGTEGSTYPDWVIPQEQASEEETIWLSIDELKSIETGVSIVMDTAQISAEVMGLPEDSNDWNDYKAQIQGASARIFVDLGDGNVRDFLVWAPTTNPWTGVKSGPDITVRDAVMWVTMARIKTDGSGIRIPLDDGTYLETDLNGWRFGFDQSTFNQQVSGVEGVNLWDVQLSPHAVVVAKAPPQGDLAFPKIHWANLEPKNPSSVKAFVDDYFTVSTVKFYPTSATSDDQAMEMLDEDGDSVYEADLSGDYTFSGTEQIVAVNDEGGTATYSGPFAPLPDHEHISGSKNWTFNSLDCSTSGEKPNRILSFGTMYGMTRDVFKIYATRIDGTHFKDSCGSNQVYWNTEFKYLYPHLFKYVSMHSLGKLSLQEYLDLHEAQIMQYEFDIIGEGTCPGLFVDHNRVQMGGGTAWAIKFGDGTYGKLQVAKMSLSLDQHKSWCDETYHDTIANLNFRYMVYKPE